jgi:hypothetical protein
MSAAAVAHVVLTLALVAATAFFTYLARGWASEEVVIVDASCSTSVNEVCDNRSGRIVRECTAEPMYACGVRTRVRGVDVAFTSVSRRMFVKGDLVRIYFKPDDIKFTATASLHDYWSFAGGYGLLAAAAMFAFMKRNQKKVKPPARQ